MAAGTAALVPAAVPPGLAASWLAAIEPFYRSARHDEGSAAGFDPYSSSLRMAALPAPVLGDVVAAVFRDRIAAECHAALGAAVVCAIDHCWVRRQYPRDRYPARHAAHRWHQDGALAFDFAAASRAGSGGDLLTMLTCWIALTPCGDDAPGLEWPDRASATLLPVARLDDAAVAVDLAGADYHRPVMAAGDALVFGGGLLHRTHVTASMSRQRTSVELRFFDASRLHARMRGWRLMALH